MAVLARGSLLRPAKGRQPAAVGSLCAWLREAAHEGVRVGGLGVACQRLGSGGLGLEVGICCWGERGSTGRGEAVAACFCGARAPLYREKGGGEGWVVEGSSTPSMAALTQRFGERVAARCDTRAMARWMREGEGTCP
jgi:hypothetical protein